KIRPSEVVTRMAGSATAPPSVTTCVLVSTWPSSSRMTPDPLPDSLEPATSIVTTEGSTSLAMAVVSLTDPGLLTVTLCGPVADCEAGRSNTAVPMALPPNPATPPTRAAARVSPATFTGRPLWRCSVLWAPPCAGDPAGSATKVGSRLSVGCSDGAGAPVAYGGRDIPCCEAPYGAPLGGVLVGCGWAAGP